MAGSVDNWTLIRRRMTSLNSQAPGTQHAHSPADPQFARPEMNPVQAHSINQAKVATNQATETIKPATESPRHVKEASTQSNEASKQWAGSTKQEHEVINQANE